MKTTSLFLSLMMIGGGILAVAQTAQQTATVPKVKIGAQQTAKAITPAPGPTAKNTATSKPTIICTMPRAIRRRI